MDIDEPYQAIRTKGVDGIDDTELAKVVLHGKSWNHVFWPRRLDPATTSKRAQFDVVEDILLHRLRHLPFERNVELAIARFGEGIRPLMTEWRRIWDEAMPVEDLELRRKKALIEAATAQDEGEMPPEGWPSRSAMQQAAHFHARQGRLAEAAEIFGQAEGWSSESERARHVRDVEQHILEDATTMVALVREGVPFSALTLGHAPATLLHLGKGHSLREVAEDEDGRNQLDEAWKRSVQAVNPYWTCQAFLDMAGRNMCVAREGDHVVMTLLDMRAQGHSKAFLKTVRMKGGTWVIDLTGVMTFEEMSLRLHKTLGNAYLHTGSLLVQEFVPFGIEHRFFVVGDRIVASTASCRTLSVTDAPKGILDPRVARLHNPASAGGLYDRGASTDEVDRPLVAAMAIEARKLARALRDEGRIGDCYVIDMGVTVRSLREGGTEILPIELNTILYAGLYAANYDSVARALSRRLSRTMRLPSGANSYANEWSPVPSGGSGSLSFRVTEREDPAITSLAKSLIGVFKNRKRDKPKSREVTAEILIETMARLEGMIAEKQGGADR